MPSYETTLFRALVAIFAGAFIGAAFITTEYLVGIYQILGLDHLREYGVSKGLGVFAVSSVVWLVGLLVFGGIPWFLLHRLNRRGWRTAAIAGAFIPFAVTFALSTEFLTGTKDGHYSSYSQGGQQWAGGVLTACGWKMAFINSLWFAGHGFLIAMAIWITAYRRVPITDTAPNKLPSAENI